MTDIAGLIERLEAATGVDPELNGDLLLHFGWNADGFGRVTDPDGNPRLSVPDLMGSLDASKALTERVRPGAGWAAGKTPGGTGWARVFKAREYYSEAPTPAIALLIALLKSLETEQ